jgi:HD superfamily phosphohydrolase
MPSHEVGRIQDAVHGLMEFAGLETAVLELLSARELQRLRRVRQLGLAHLVFPSAEHSRLAHAIGAAHLAVRFGRHLEEATRDTLTAGVRPDSEACRDLAIAALCHDLGHGPLSHAWEREVQMDFQRSAWVESLGLDQHDGALGELSWHELVTQGLLLWEGGDIHRMLEALEEGTSARIARMLRGDHYLSYLPRLLNSDIDVDRCDYVIRDAIHAGVAYGRYDLTWLISTAAIGCVEERLVVGFDSRKAPRVMEQFLVARRALYDTVYQHKTTRAAEVMVGLLLRRLRDMLASGEDPGLGERFEPYRRALAGEALKPEEILALDDYSLWVLIMHIAQRMDGDCTATDLAGRIVRRELFKEIRLDPADLNQALSVQGMTRISDGLSAAGVLSGEPRYYLGEDYLPFETLSRKEPQAAYLIEHSANGLGRGFLASQQAELSHLVERDEPRRRLFAPAEAMPVISGQYRSLRTG